MVWFNWWQVCSTQPVAHFSFPKRYWKCLCQKNQMLLSACIQELGWWCSHGAEADSHSWGQKQLIRDLKTCIRMPEFNHLVFEEVIQGIRVLQNQPYWRVRSCIVAVQGSVEKYVGQKWPLSSCYTPKLRADQDLVRLLPLVCPAICWLPASLNDCHIKERGLGQGEGCFGCVLFPQIRLWQLRTAILLYQWL